nr:DUF4340 domain-containing protein [Saprospiraceae bacterium]
MTRTLLYLVILIVLLGAAGFFVYQQSDAGKPDTSDRNFAVKNLDEVGKVFIAGRDGESLALVRKGDQWIINDKFPANPNTMEMILRALKDVEIKYVPTKASYSHIIQTLAGRGLKVEVYDRRDNLMKSYYIGGVPQDERGNFYIMEGAEQPYVVHIPYFTGTLRTRFELTEDQLRAKEIFSEKASEIESISVQYPAQQHESFTIHRKNNSFELSPFSESMPAITRPMHPGLLESYIRNYQKIGVESFLNDLPQRDSIVAARPFVTITMERTDGTVKSYDFHQRYPYPIIGPYGAREADAEDYLLRFYVSDNNTGDFMTTQYRVLNKIFWGYSWFFRSTES